MSARDAELSASRRKTAIRRPDLSRPVALALRDGLISETSTVFDYGCGHGDDVRRCDLEIEAGDRDLLRCRPGIEDLA